MEGRKGWGWVGKCYVGLRDQDGRPAVVIGPDCEIHSGAFFLFLYAVLGTIGGVFTFYLAPRVSYEFQVIGVVVYVFLQGSYFLTAVANPGMGDRGKEESLSSPLLLDPYCHHCHSHQPASAVHCTICGICVLNRDHHCPWIGKCIGEDNSIYFNCFISGLLVMIMYMLICYALLSDA